MGPVKGLSTVASSGAGRQPPLPPKCQTLRSPVLFHLPNRPVMHADLCPPPLAY